MFSKSRMVRAAATAVAAATLVIGAGLPASATAGPDVSSWQHPHRGAISWTKVKATGATFVFIKATEGFGYTNPYFAADWTGSADAGLMHGAYHFARPTRRLRSAVVQARHFAWVIGASRARGTLPPTLDLESSGGLSPRRLIAWTATWLRTVKSLTGRKPMIYSYPLFWSQHMAGTRAFRSYPLWGACYCSSPTRFRGAWSHWTFWQYASSSRVRGVAGRTDMNRFNGSAAQLRRLARGGAPSTGGTTGGDGEGRRARHPSSASTAARHHRHKRATKLIVHAPSRARRLASFRVVGRLTTNAGRPLPRRTVHLQGRLMGRRHWHRLTTATTNARGRFRVRLRAPRSAQIRARFYGTPRRSGASSRLVTIRVHGARGR